MAKNTVLIVACLLLRFTAATEVENCGGDANAAVSISNCESPPCILKRNTTIKLTIEMTPDEDIPQIQNSVHALIGAIEMPFIGVHGTDACKNIYTLDGSEAGCPLKKGQKVLYKNEFFVHKVYPKVRPVVIWKLKAPADKEVICFQMPAKITD